MKNSNKFSERLSKHLKQMSREELMNIKGGVTMENPTGYYKCCLDSASSICSDTVAHIDIGDGAELYCQEGSHLVGPSY